MSYLQFEKCPFCGCPAPIDRQMLRFGDGVSIGHAYDEVCPNCKNEYSVVVTSVVVRKDDREFNESHLDAR
jgi:hypothetical protein